MIKAAIEYAAASGVVTIAEDGSDQGDWEAEARRGFDAFIEMVVAQPAAARVALIEAYGAGAEAMAPIEAAVAGFEWLTRQTLERSPERAGMPAGADHRPHRIDAGNRQHQASPEAGEGAAELAGHHVGDDPLLPTPPGAIAHGRPNPAQRRGRLRGPRPRGTGHPRLCRGRRREGYAATTVDEIVGKGRDVGDHLLRQLRREGGHPHGGADSFTFRTARKNSS